jgi:hypothetical protein
MGTPNEFIAARDESRRRNVDEWRKVAEIAGALAVIDPAGWGERANRLDAEYRAALATFSAKTEGR